MEPITDAVIVAVIAGVVSVLVAWITRSRFNGDLERKLNRLHEQARADRELWRTNAQILNRRIEGLEAALVRKEQEIAALNRRLDSK